VTNTLSALEAMPRYKYTLYLLTYLQE